MKKIWKQSKKIVMHRKEVPFMYNHQPAASELFGIDFFPYLIRFLYLNNYYVFLSPFFILFVRVCMVGSCKLIKRFKMRRYSNDILKWKLFHTKQFYGVVCFISSSLSNLNRLSTLLIGVGIFAFDPSWERRISYQQKQV